MTTRKVVFLGCLTSPTA